MVLERATGKHGLAHRVGHGVPNLFHYQKTNEVSVSKNNNSLDILEKEVANYGLSVLRKRFARLQSRKFVLFRFLRAKLLLRKIRFLKG
jgi:hypothetical protein